MTILSAQTIRKRCQLPSPLVSPFSERMKYNGMSYGLSAAGYDVRLDQELRIDPGEFRLCSTLEHFNIPADLLAFVHDKSTLARRGLAVQNTVLECGWSGYLTLEITNHGPDHVFLDVGSPIAQIVFHLLDEPTEQPYTGKYSNQSRGPQPAIMG